VVALLDVTAQRLTNSTVVAGLVTPTISYTVDDAGENPSVLATASIAPLVLFPSKNDVEHLWHEPDFGGRQFRRESFLQQWLRRFSVFSFLPLFLFFKKRKKKDREVPVRGTGSVVARVDVPIRPGRVRGGSGRCSNLTR
jgi:hypothetical protein